jgi:SH3-like domain-containing protein
MMSKEPSLREVVVREAYAAQYADPIVLRQGDIVQVQQADAEFVEWLWCRGPDGKEGWVHRSFLSESSGHATAISDYSAREVTVSAGERGRIIQALNGWALVELEGNRVGWVPEGVLQTSNI